MGLVMINTKIGFLDFDRLIDIFSVTQKKTAIICNCQVKYMMNSQTGGTRTTLAMIACSNIFMSLKSVD